MLASSKTSDALIQSTRLPLINTLLLVWVPALTAALYPWILDAFHWAVTPSATGQTAAGGALLAALLLIAAFAVPLINLLIASRPENTATPTAQTVRARRFALLAVTAPTVYVFFGVLTYMAGSKVPDEWIWTPAWLLFGYWASRTTNAVISPLPRMSARLRVAHGISGSVAAAYALFHIFNHLFGLISPDAHAAVMDMGRTVYRAKLIEPLLVAVMLFQIGSGLRLFWTWSETNADRYRMFQIASGIFMAVFILGHMNSVFFYARTWLNIQTDWAFAAGLPTGLIHDAWNIRLLPHYALGVFFVLAHLVSGIRVVMLAHGAALPAVNRLWWMGVSLSVLIAAAIMCGMTGLRLV